MNAYGYLVTAAGHRLIAKTLAGEQLRMTKVLVGSGYIPEGVDPAELTALVDPVAEATSTSPIVVANTVSMVVEYRSDLNGGLKEDFWLREFGIFAEDPDDGEILLYYGNLGDKPQNVNAYIDGRVDVRRFPVKIIVHSGTHVTIDWAAGAWMTMEDVLELLRAHNLDPDAHPPLNPNTYIATVKHGLGLFPVCALNASAYAYGVGGYGEGGYGGTPLRGVRVRLDPVDRNTVRVFVPEQYNGFTQVKRLNKHDFSLSKPGSVTTLTLTLR